MNGFNDDPSLTPDGKGLVFTRMSISGPIEIYSAATEFSICEVYWKDAKSPSVQYDRPDCQLSRAQPLTHINGVALSQVAMSPIESFWFNGAHNEKVEGFLVKPPNFDASKKYPVKFLIHGGPQGAWHDEWHNRWNYPMFAAPGYAVVAINPRGSTGYGQKFTDQISQDWTGRVYEDLMKGLDHAIKTYPFLDESRMAALGGSYGGFMVNWIAGHSDRFRALISHAGVFDLTSKYGTTEELWIGPSISSSCRLTK